MKYKNSVQSTVGGHLILVLLVLICFACGGGNTSKTNIKPNEPKTESGSKIVLSVDAPEVGSAIYLNGEYTGEVTPAEILLDAGEYSVGVGLKESRQYLKTTLSVVADTGPMSISLDSTHLQPAKVWQALFIGVNQVQTPAGTCVSEYSSQELDAAFEFFIWSFKQRVEGYSYNTMQWQFDRRDISDQVVTLSDENLITPEIIDNYISDVSKGSYDLIVSFFRGGAGSDEGCFIDDFKGIAWYDYRVLNSDASYFTIRYYDDVQGNIDASKLNDADPGMFIHEWLHTTAEWFFPDRGYTMPIDNGQVVHAAGAYNYSFPWMTWYRDLISGQVKQGNHYVGIGPEAFLACTVRESALEACDASE